jgi:hypothetical protein
MNKKKKRNHKDSTTALNKNSNSKTEKNVNHRGSSYRQYNML